MRIELKYGKGFKWNSLETENYNIHYKGYFTNNVFYDEYRNVGDFDSFESWVSRISGCFAIIVHFKNTCVYAATDISRSFPIFYSSDGDIISDMAENIRLYKSVEKENVDLSLYSAMLATRYASPGKTVYKEICQLRAAEVACINGKEILCKQYYCHLRKEDRSKSIGHLKKKFEHVSSAMIDNLETTLKGKKVVLPLSGGYDSRFIACLLKSKGYDNVVCYTYGRKSDYEVQYSEAVAKKLGFEWVCVEYTKEKWSSFFEDETVKEYFNSSHNHCSLPHIQDYLALDELINKGIIRPGDVVIPGFCGDFPAGSFTGIPNTISYNISTLVDYIISEHYVNVKLKPNIVNENKKNLIKYFNENHLCVTDRESFISCYEKWLIESRLTMWVINSVRVYEHFNLEWRLPMWEKEYLDFWYSIPSEYRTNCNFYIDMLMNGIFKEYEVTFLKPKPSNTHSNPVKSFVATSLKKLLITCSMISGKDFYKRNNINNYNEAAIWLLRRLPSKKGYHFSSLSVHLIEQLWWCQNIYGKDNYKKVVRL